MFDTVFGLPLHPLVVHAVVVLAPLAALLVVAIALRPSWRTGPLAWLTVFLATLAAVATPVATQSGEALARRVGDPEQHAALGEALIYFMVPLLAAAVALVLMGYRQRREALRVSSPTVAAARSPLTTLIAVAAVVVAVAAVVQVAFVGHSGASATWSSEVTASGQSTG
jgi:uncharacterized membrane protein